MARSFRAVLLGFLAVACSGGLAHAAGIPGSSLPSPSDAPSAARDGTVDAIRADVIAAPFRPEHPGIGFETLRPQSQGIDFHGDGLFARIAHRLPAAPERPGWGRTGGLGLALMGTALALLATALAWLRSVRRAVAQATAEIKASEARFRDFAETASDWFWEQDAELRFTYFSDNCAQMTGLAPEALLGRRREEVRLPLANGPDWQQHLRDLQARRPFRGFVYPYRDGSGAIRWIEISGKPVFDARGVFQGYRGTGHEVTLRVEAMRHLQEKAHHDPLTGMPNRLMLETQLAAALGCMRCIGGSVALLLIDLDGFKLVNDRHGHLVGDRVLIAWAERLGMTVRAADCIARLGGDEFAVIVTLKGPNADPRNVAERIVAAAAQPFVIDDRVVHLGASVGIARAPRDAATMADLLACADQALYRAKAAGRGCFAAYNEAGPQALPSPTSPCELARLRVGTPKEPEAVQQLSPTA